MAAEIFPVKSVSIKMTSRLTLIVLAVFVYASCGRENSGRIILWTDRPEFAFYVEYFNAAQSRYKAEVRYFEFPGKRLAETNEAPDIVAASWLNNASVINHFMQIDDLFDAKSLDGSLFYSQLLESGSVDGSQFLIPLSFNLSAFIFSNRIQDEYAGGDPLVIDFEEIKENSLSYNLISGGGFSRIGFSPFSNDHFLSFSSMLLGAEFQEVLLHDIPVSWNSEALDTAVAWFKDWFGGDAGIKMEGDFASRYYHEPVERLIDSGRILYAFIDSSAFFAMTEERRAGMNFKWAGKNGVVPFQENIVYCGIHRRSKNRKGAEAFAIWFLSAETQRLLLEESKNKGLDKLYFGIAGGFSAMTDVTEQIFPEFYRELSERMPRKSSFSAPYAVPLNWTAIRGGVIIPYLHERIREPDAELQHLYDRIRDWYRFNNLY